MCIHAHARTHIHTHTLTGGGGRRGEGGKEEGRNRQFHLEAEIETLSLLNVQAFVPKKNKIAQRSYMEKDKGEGR